ncbi:glycoside hydrolase family 127 protein [Spirosoma sp. HMF4905]|uniref:Glycoside hydrolase family 127 protein n=1 Tax=Spirosoma arboris TaxID=2682092 RepID=A0A7K1SI26_9BACT|nr:glycoside hydrolase family 127 protein [Spirosoma arboris]MVM33452.1 glycoside hydrolase family 127 protein [Spirosoma arboris]
MKKLVVTITLSLLAAIGFSQSYAPEQDNPTVKVKPVVSIKAYAFPLGAVKLLDSPFKRAMEADTRYLLELKPDRLLSEFRVHSGLKAKAEKYGGWESSGLAGHTLGHYLSACALQYTTSNDPEYLKRVNYIVDELAECQQARKTGYVGAIPREDSVFAEVSQGIIRSRGFDLNGAWSPWYTVHKVMAGLLDAYLYCTNDKALKVNVSMADWAGEILKNLNDEQIQKMLLCEYGGMNDVLVNTYSLTGNKKYLDLSYKFHDKRILDSLAVHKDILPGRHSNTQVPKLIGTIRRYELTGNQNDFAMSDFFWNTVVNHHTYAPGGNSNYEYLSTPDQLNDKLTDNTMETCNTYNMLKLTRHLFALHPSSSYMDFYERGLYNHILASQNHKTGMVCYFVPLRMGTRKHFSDEEESFTCCVGSGMENHVKYGESIYFKGADGSLYVNLFIPSELNWTEKGLRLTMTSNLPTDPTVSLTVQADKAIAVPIRIRKPSWINGEMTVRVNGKSVSTTRIEEGYVVIARKWKTGDKIEFTLPANLRYVAMPDNPARQAFFYGPVLLAGDLGAKEPDPMQGVPVFVTNNTDPNQWLKPDSQPLEFETTNTGTQSAVKLKPFYELQANYYTVYWDVFTPESWKKQQAVYEQKRREAADLERRTVDLLRVGEMQPERDHNFTGDKLETGEDHTRKFRVANGGSSMTFTMKTDPNAQNILIGTYWGMDNRGRLFEVLVDDKVIASEDLNKYKESRFYDISYTIPAELTKGKESVTIKLQAKPNNSAGPVYGLRLVRE